MDEPRAKKPLTGYTDDELIIAINNGEAEEGLSVIQSRYGSKVRRFVRGIVKDDWLAQDVAQETFVKVFFKSHLYQIGTSFKAWVFEIARNQALSALRSRRRAPRPVASLNFVGSHSELDLLDQVFTDSSNRDLETKEFMGAFDEAVADLPENYRAVFRECVIKGRSYQEVGDTLRIPTGTVAIRIMRARKRLFASLSPHLDRLRRPPACVQ